MTKNSLVNNISSKINSNRIEKNIFNLNFNKVNKKDIFKLKNLLNVKINKKVGSLFSKKNLTERFNIKSNNKNIYNRKNSNLNINLFKSTHNNIYNFTDRRNINRTKSNKKTKINSKRDNKTIDFNFINFDKFGKRNA